jgi:hypothetical protein
VVVVVVAGVVVVVMGVVVVLVVVLLLVVVAAVVLVLAMVGVVLVALELVRWYWYSGTPVLEYHGTRPCTRSTAGTSIATSICRIYMP